MSYFNAKSKEQKRFVTKLLRAEIRDRNDPVRIEVINSLKYNCQLLRKNVLRSEKCKSTYTAEYKKGLIIIDLMKTYHYNSKRKEFYSLSKFCKVKSIKNVKLYDNDIHISCYPDALDQFLIDVNNNLVTPCCLRNCNFMVHIQRGDLVVCDDCKKNRKQRAEAKERFVLMGREMRGTILNYL